MADQEAGVIWADANGSTRLLTIKTLAGWASIRAQMLLKSNGGDQMWWQGPIQNPASPVAVGVFQSVQDGALLSFQTASGSIIKLLLPAPQLGIFMADHQTVDPAQIVALIASCIGSLSDGAGNAAISYIGGFYTRSGRIIRGG